MNLNYWNVTLSLLKTTKRKLKLSIRSRATNLNDRYCFTIRVRGRVYDTTYYAIWITMSVSGSRGNHSSFSITCRSTIWRRTRSRSSWTWSVAFQTLARHEMRYTVRPFVTNGSPIITTIGDRYIPNVGTPEIIWSPTVMSEPRIPTTSSLAEVLGGSLLHEQ